MSPRINLSVKVPYSYAGNRLDQIVSELFPDFSRSRLQGWIKAGDLLVDSRKLKPNAKLSGGESILLDAELHSAEEWDAEDIPLDIVYEDAHIIVLNKPRGLVVHPAAGNWTGTLLNGLLFHYPELRHIPRAGIVHRLDKETTGLMVVARNIIAQLSLVEQLQERTVSRTYWALAKGDVSDAGSIDAPIGRHPSQRTKMAVVNGGKEAVTHYKSLKRYSGYTLVELKLQTGRTHQIRVHMAHKGFPLLGDAVYGQAIRTKEAESLPAEMLAFSRQALHAKSLGLIHPNTQEMHTWEIDLPEDMRTLLSVMDEFKCP